MTITKIKDRQHGIDLAKLEQEFMMQVSNLVESFLWPINRKLGDSDPVKCEYGVRFVEFMKSVNGVMCCVTCKLKGALTASETISLLNMLDQAYCMAPGDPDDGPKISGYKWFLGDGDDMSAVQFVNGEIQIWLRGWK